MRASSSCLLCAQWNRMRVASGHRGPCSGRVQKVWASAVSRAGVQRAGKKAGVQAAQLLPGERSAGCCRGLVLLHADVPACAPAHRLHCILSLLHEPHVIVAGRTVSVIQRVWVLLLQQLLVERQRLRMPRASSGVSTGPSSSCWSTCSAVTPASSPVIAHLVMLAMVEVGIRQPLCQLDVAPAHALPLEVQHCDGSYIVSGCD